ncbi:MAG TPA: ATP-binding protein [Alphaproteobacteria bacterium]|nr:ATP-binding protein [Alphaproteobacteria bacterium]
MRRIRRFVAIFSAARGVDRAEQARIAILIEELLTNLMKYGHPGHVRARHVDVSLHLLGKQMTIVFTDNGRAFNLLAHPPPDLERPLEERPVGQLGLQIVRELAHELSYNRVRGHNVIRLIRHLAPFRRAMPTRIRARRL